MPVCLIKCKRALYEIDLNNILEVLVEDPEAVEILVKIIERSRDQVIKWHREGDHYRIQIKKG